MTFWPTRSSGIPPASQALPRCRSRHRNRRPKNSSAASDGSPSRARISTAIHAAAISTTPSFRRSSRARKRSGCPFIYTTVPPKPVADMLYGGFSPSVTGVFASSGWGWHIETAVHLLRMILGGVFDRHPKLQVVIGHMGEAIPFMLQRMDRTLSQQMTKLARPVSDYLRQNVHYTFGGFNFTPTFLNLLLEIGVERIMFSVDYP